MPKLVCNQPVKNYQIQSKENLLKKIEKIKKNPNNLDIVIDFDYTITTNYYNG